MYRKNKKFGFKRISSIKSRFHTVNIQRSKKEEEEGVNANKLLHTKNNV
jgi:hypothetical protein